MATQGDLAKFEVKAFAMLDKHFPAGRGTGSPFQYSHEDQRQPRAHPHQSIPQLAGVINSKDAAQAFGEKLRSKNTPKNMTKNSFDVIIFSVYTNTS